MKNFTHWDELFASPTDPLPASDVDHRINVAEHCLMVLVSGEGATWEHWNVCRVAVNFMEVFIRLGYAVDPDGLLADADAALRRSRSRAETDRAVPYLSGADAGAMLALLEDYAECLRAVSARSAIRAMRATEKAMAKAL